MESIEERYVEDFILSLNKKEETIMRYYTGIGSRNTPEEVQREFVCIAKFLAMHGLTLRSGGAKGADSAFEIGCNIVKGNKEIYLPWRGFENSTSDLIVTQEKAFLIAEMYHPYWSRLSPGVRKLQARNSHQVLGKDLETPSDLVICYTPNGSGKGGTGQALRIAKDKNIPISDRGSYDSYEVFFSNIRKILGV